MNLKLDNFFFLTVIVVWGAYSQDYVIESKSSILNYTEIFQKGVNSHDKVIVKEGVYGVEFDKIELNQRIIIRGEGHVVIYGLGDKTKKETQPSAIFSVINPKFLKIEGITFLDQFNRAYAIKILKTEFNDPCKSIIELSDNIAKKIGMLWIGSINGFTYNRGEGSSWYEKGGLNKNNWQSEIIIKNNYCFGSKNFSPGFFGKVKHGVSAFSLFFTNNVVFKENFVQNYRFGIWIYGGATLNEKRSKLQTSQVLCENIKVADNYIADTYCPIWFSKSKNIVVTRNFSINNQDVAIDFEGSHNARVTRNTVINSKGGAFTVLNGSTNITFSKNMVKMKKYSNYDNIVLIRNSNKNIKYFNNDFEYVNENRSHKSRIMVTRTFSGIEPSTKILFQGNNFKNVMLMNKDGSQVLKF